MGLKNLVSGLLPATYREQVLGDLSERGSHLRDIINVVPRIWWCHLTRTFLASAPQIAGASDAAIRARTEQLAREGALASYVRYAALWALYVPFRRGLPQFDAGQAIVACVAVALLGVPAYFLFLRRALPESNSLNSSRRQLLTAYSQQIDYQLTQARSMLYPPSAIVLLWLFASYQYGSLPTFLLVALPVSVGLASLASRRISRLRSELVSLELAS